MTLYRVTVVRHVEEIAQIEVRESSEERAAALVNRDLSEKRPLLTPDWQRGGVIEPAHAVATEAA